MTLINPIALTIVIGQISLDADDFMSWRERRVVSDDVATIGTRGAQVHS